MCTTLSQRRYGCLEARSRSSRGYATLIDDFAVSDIVNITQFRGYLTHEQVVRSIRLFAERVMPAFPLTTASR